MFCWNTSRLECLHLLVLVGVASAACAPTRASASEAVVGKATHVTLFRGQAQVTRTIPVEGEAGNVEIVVARADSTE